MEYRDLGAGDAAALLPLYIGYYNRHEEGQWTEESAGRRIRQVLGMDGGWGLALMEAGEPLGFAMGYFKPYDDLTSFVLEEIVVAGERQGQGLGTRLLAETERRVRARGAAGVELQAVNSPLHAHFYQKAGYGDAKNFVLKVKWFPAGQPEADGSPH